jgi:hypothetical protein
VVWDNFSPEGSKGDSNPGCTRNHLAIPSCDPRRGETPQGPFPPSVPRMNTWSPTPMRELLVLVSPSTCQATHFSHGFLTQPAEPAKPTGTLTHTCEYPYPECGCGYLVGTGLGSSEIPQGYLCCSLHVPGLPVMCITMTAGWALKYSMSLTLRIAKYHCHP